MDLERLTLAEVSQMSKLIELLGQPASIDDIKSRCDVLDGALTLYRKELAKAREDSKRHGD